MTELADPSVTMEPRPMSRVPLRVCMEVDSWTTMAFEAARMQSMVPPTLTELMRLNSSIDSSVTDSSSELPVLEGILLATFRNSVDLELRTHSGTVDEIVDSPELFDRAIYHGLDTGFVRDVYMEDQGLVIRVGCKLDTGCGCLVGLVFVEVREDDGFRSCFGERESCFLANSGCRLVIPSLSVTFTKRLVSTVRTPVIRATPVVALLDIFSRGSQLSR